MTRWMKKAIAFGLAISIFAGCMVASAEEVQDNGISVVEEAVYDEAVSFLDTVVLLENGHWAKMVEDEATGESTPYSDVTVDTNIVFIDANGNKKVISNKNSNGEQVFDAVHPEITRLDDDDLIRVVKGDKEAFITPEGDFYGSTLEFHKEVQFLSKDYVWVSDDQINYSLINRAGETVYRVSGLERSKVIGSFIYIECVDKILIIREDDKNIVKEYLGSYRFDVFNDSYIEVTSSEEIIILDSDAEEKLRFNTNEVTYPERVKFGDDYVKVNRLNADREHICEIINIATGESVGVFKKSTECYEDGYILDREGGIFTNLDGTVRIDLNELADKIRVDLYRFDCKPWFKYSEGILYGEVTSTEDNDAITYLFKEKNGFDTTELVKVKGVIRYINEDRDRYILTNNRGKIWGIYNYSNELIKDFTVDTERSYYLNGNDFPNMNNVMTSVNTIVDEKYYNIFINQNGSMSSHYETCKDSRTFIFGGTSEGRLEVLNGSGNVVYSGEGEYEPMTGTGVQIKFLRNAYSLSNRDYFVVSKDGICSLYDINGNKVELPDSYSGIGPCEGIRGYYNIGSANIGVYQYSSDDLENGLCVTRKTDEDGNYKYGVIKFNNILDKGDCNGDGKINAEDALAVLKHAAKISQLSDESVAEVTGDSKVNAEDALQILKYAARLIDSF